MPYFDKMSRTCIVVQVRSIMAKLSDTVRQAASDTSSDHTLANLINADKIRSRNFISYLLHVDDLFSNLH